MFIGDLSERKQAAARAAGENDTLHTFTNYNKVAL
jgi:hypothetical protein